MTGRALAHFSIGCWIFLGLAVWSAPTLAQEAVDDFPEITDSASERQLRPMDAQKAVESMTLPPGFKVQLYASEPEVQNPIGMALDGRGRLWVAENYTYSDRTQRFDLSLRDRVLIFEDSDGDGRADSRRVFTDKVQMLTSVELGRGGAWLLCPPQLLFVPDANGDDVPDGPAQVVIDGFHVAQDNYHNFANGLRWGPDGWLYGRCGHSCPGRLGLPGTPDQLRVPIDGGIWRYHPDRKIVEVLCHGTTNPWGHDWDDNGELFFVNTVIGHLWHMMPGAHLKESFGESMNPDVYERMDMVADHYHFDTRGNWSESREGQANDLGGGHAHIGAAIIKNTNWPEELRGRLMTINMHGQRVNVDRLERHGAGYVARHQPDFLVARDPFFRGLDLRETTDGQLFLIDWSDTGECHEHTGIHRTSGRVYKIVYTSSNSVAGQPTAPSNRIGELLSRYRAGRLTSTELRQLLGDPDEHVRVWAIRLLTDFWPLDTIVGPMPEAQYPRDDETVGALRSLAREDRSGLVHLALASVLQRLPIDARAGLAHELVRHAEHADDRDLPLLVWYGLIPLANASPESMVAIAEGSTWPRLHRWIARKLASISRQAPQALEKLLVSSESWSPAAQQQALLGLSDAYRGWRKAVPPAHWPRLARSPGAVQVPEVVRGLNTLFGDGKALEELVAIVRDNRAEMQSRQQALESLIESRPANLRQICESVLDTRVLNGTALRGLALFSEAEIGKSLVQKYRRFQPEDRPAVLEILVSRPTFAEQLFNALALTNSPVPLSDLTGYHARQIRSLNDPRLSSRLAEVWGELRETPAARRELIDRLKRQMTGKVLAQADLTSGKLLYTKNCSHCHQLFGQGKKIGPDLSGAQRTNIDYLLENIVDPSAVVGRGFAMSRVLTTDGRVLGGLIVSRNEKTLVIQTQTQLETLAVDEVERVEATSLSPMPDGMLDNLSPDEIRDLLAYLMSPGGA